MRDLTYFIVQTNEEMKGKGLQDDDARLSDKHFRFILSDMFFGENTLTVVNIYYRVI